MERNTPIINMLNEYTMKNPVRFHMPGHKGKPYYFGGEYLSGDVTELSFSDNLHIPNGVIAESQRLHSVRIGAGHSFYSVNGASAGVMAMILAAVRPGDKIIMARDMHLSAVNALRISRICPVFIRQPDEASFLPQLFYIKYLKEAILNNPDAKAVYVTYPNYFGFCLNLSEIAKITHDAGMALIVDGAHSAHFCYSDMLPKCCASAGADVWTVSAHKTLPCINQGAFVNVGKNSLIDAKAVEDKLKMLTTTSPSYILLSSLDYVSEYMDRCGREEISRVVSLTEQFTDEINDIPGIKTVDIDSLPENVFDKDPLKLIIDVSGKGLTGFSASRILEYCGVFVEAADARHILAIITVADEKEDFERLVKALKLLEEGKGSSDFLQYIYPKLQKVSTPAQVDMREKVSLPLEEAESLIAATPIGIYPPGVPIVFPGEQITQQVVRYLLAAKKEGFELFGIEDGNVSLSDF